MFALLTRGIPSLKKHRYFKEKYQNSSDGYESLLVIFEIFSSKKLLENHKNKFLQLEDSNSEDGKPKPPDVHIRMPRMVNTCPPGSSSLRLALVVLSIGAASHFLLFLDSVVDNLLPAAMPFFLSVYETKENANHAWEMLVSSRIYGLAIGCFIAVLLSHRHGRKLPVVVGTILDVIGVILTLLITYVPHGVTVATIGRLINGIGQGMVQTAGSVMLSELPPLNKRGTVLATLTMWACMELWQWAMGFPLLVLLPALYIICHAPESPRYLFLENRENEARKAMSYYQSPADCKQSIEEILIEKQYVSLSATLQMVKEKIDENGNSSKKEKDTLWNTIIERLKDGNSPERYGIFQLWISYSTQIFENFGLSSGKAQTASLIMSLPQAVISVALLGCFDNFDRRTLLIVPTILSVIFGFLAIVFSSPGLSNLVPLFVIIPILATFDLSVAAISGESAYAIVPELFLANDKVLGSAIVGIVQNGFGGVLTNCLLTALTNHGISNVLVPFVAMNTIYAAVTYKWLPETNGKTPQEISRHFSPEFPGTNFYLYVKHKCSKIAAYLTAKPVLLNVISFIVQLVGCIFLLDFGVSIFKKIGA
ncbi:Protein CBR-SLCF-2 [Caenorhabditis briggsae]|uniref:Protein CBR-SLCF-2 n=1 Tax=Caenorhabditis briggsae TaxID=6238 RepID=A8XJI0_CAEBR|nr:Protein CBR-SLCF-2 [Caenorhabditis briggsae]CAP32805.2 Protein CBR-SLCF-2 [Caenorhabditis briggsae]